MHKHEQKRLHLRDEGAINSTDVVCPVCGTRGFPVWTTSEEKTVKHIMQRRQNARLAFAASLMILSVGGARAQVVSTPYGSLPLGARSINLSPSALYTVNPINTITQNYSVFGSANGSAAYYGGFATINPSGAYFIGPDGMPASPIFVVGGSVGTSGNSISPYGRPRAANTQPPQGVIAGANKDANAIGANAQPVLSLKQMLSGQRDSHDNLRITWTGGPAIIAQMDVTLLNQYHLPLVSASSENGAPVAFVASRNSDAARYYRARIQFADGAEASVIGKIK